jgi:segregation and condensation protein B
MTTTKNRSVTDQRIEISSHGICWQPTLPGFEEQLDESADIRSSEVEITTEKKQKSHVTTDAHFRIKRIIEALLFASSEPITFNKLREVIDTISPLAPRELRAIIEELQNEYCTQQRAFRLDEIAQGFVLRSAEEFNPYIELLYRNKRNEKLSHASAEVLAIIAYRQPITRTQIEAIRGVDSSGSVATLLERQLIQPVGKLEAPGRPMLYGITKDFLKHFGLKDIKELPKLEGIYGSNAL